MSSPKTRNKGRDKTWKPLCGSRLDGKTIVKLIVCIVILLGIGAGTVVGVQKKIKNKETKDLVKGTA